MTVLEMLQFADGAGLRRPRAGFLTAAAAGVLGGVAGCSPTANVPPSRPAAAQVVHESGHAEHEAHDEHGKHDGHADHEHPETLAAGVAELKALWGHVKGALKSGDRDSADEKVHMVGHLLEDVEQLLAKEQAEVQDVGRKAAQEVFDCFDSLDTAFHAGEDDWKKIDVDALGEKLEKAIATLEGVASRK